jgi:hypothetical protein
VVSERRRLRVTEDGLHRLELNLHPNEASGLLAVEDGALLEAHGWELAFWAVLDEGEIEDCVAVIGHRSGAGIGEGWEIERLHAEPVGDAGKTEDAEAVTRHDGWIYVFGSHFGGKDGPLQPKRGFVARFREADVGHATQDPAMEMEISRQSFVLHRLINDALKSGGPDLIPLGPESRKALIEATIMRGEKENKRWAGLVREDDYPINIEGAAFREDGSLLLGLRFPVSAEGCPVLVELEGTDRLFEPGDSLPEVRGFWVVDAVGRKGDVAGVRDLALLSTADGEELHLVTGNVDSRDKDSVLIQDYPGGRSTVATHFRCTLPPDAHSGNLTGEFVREFPDLPRVEGIAITDGGRFFYVTDEDEGVHLRLTRLLAD